MKQLLLGLFLWVMGDSLSAQMLEWHIRDNYVEIAYMGNNLFKVKTPDGKWGVVNEYGALSIEAAYDSITPLVENRALLLDVTGQFLKGIINEEGQLIKSFSHEERLANCSSFQEGLLPYGIVSGNYYLFGYLDLQGNVSIEPNYFWAAPFQSGKAVVQYKSKNYGIIDPAGSPLMTDNRKFKFMSSPVDNQLLIVYAGSKGDKVVLAALSDDGKLNAIEDLESGTIVRNSYDYKSISCQNGHVYYFDDGLRLLSSSADREFNKPIFLLNEAQAHSSLTTKRLPKGWSIDYEGRHLLTAPFVNLTTCGETYAIVTTPKQTVGVLKLNRFAQISLDWTPEPAIFYHHLPLEEKLSLQLEGVQEDSQIEIGIVGLRDDDSEERYAVPAGHQGKFEQKITYFIPSDKKDEEVSKNVVVNLYVDGMFCKSETRTLIATHKTGFSVSVVPEPKFSDLDGTANIRLIVKSLNGRPSASAEIFVNGEKTGKSFNDQESVSLEMPVKVAEDERREFSYSVAIQEEGCPVVTTSIRKTIYHYSLQ